MNLNELKSAWQHPSMTNKTDQELANLLTISKNKSSQKIRKRLIVESAMLAGLAFLYYDAFDGADRSLLVNLLLSSSLALFIAIDVAGYVVLTRPVQANTLRSSLYKFKNRLSVMMGLSLGCSVLFAASLLLFFSENIAFNARKYYLLAGCIVTFLGLFYLSYRIWMLRIRDINAALKPWEEVTG